MGKILEEFEKHFFTSCNLCSILWHKPPNNLTAIAFRKLCWDGRTTWHWGISELLSKMAKCRKETPPFRISIIQLKITFLMQKGVLRWFRLGSWSREVDFTELVFHGISVFAVAPISGEAIFLSLLSGERLVYCKCYFRDWHTHVFR